MKREYRHLWIIQYINDLRYEIKFENRVKEKTLLFFVKQKYFFSWRRMFLRFLAI